MSVINLKLFPKQRVQATLGCKFLFAIIAISYFHCHHTFAQSSEKPAGLHPWDRIETLDSFVLPNSFRFSATPITPDSSPEDLAMTPADFQETLRAWNQSRNHFSGMEIYDIRLRPIVETQPEEDGAPESIARIRTLMNGGFQFDEARIALIEAQGALIHEFGSQVIRLETEVNKIVVSEGEHFGAPPLGGDFVNYRPFIRAVVALPIQSVDDTQTITLERRQGLMLHPPLRLIPLPDGPSTQLNYTGNGSFILAISPWGAAKTEVRRLRRHYQATFSGITSSLKINPLENWGRAGNYYTIHSDGVLQAPTHAVSGRLKAEMDHPTSLVMGLCRRLLYGE